MGHFSMEKSLNPGSVLGGNQQTGGYEDGQQLHLFYGDDRGSPGSLVTFLVWQDGAAGRVGTGQVSEIALPSLPPASATGSCGR